MKMQRNKVLRGFNVMNKWKMIFIFVLVVELILIIIIDQSDYKIQSSELKNIVSKKIYEIYENKEIDYIVKDTYESGRMIIYSGVITIDGEDDPFIFGFLRNWILPFYKSPQHIISYSSEYINTPRVSLDTNVFKHGLYQDITHKIKIERKLNYEKIIPMCFAIVMTFVVFKKKRENKI